MSRGWLIGKKSEMRSTLVVERLTRNNVYATSISFKAAVCKVRPVKNMVTRWKCRAHDNRINELFPDDA